MAIKKAQAGKEVGAEGRSRGSVAVGGTIRLDDKPKVKMAPAKIEKKYVPTAKESKNLKDATEMKNMRPTGPKTGRVKPTMGGAKNGKTMKKAKSGATVKKAQNGTTKKPKLLTVPRTRQIADSLDNVASQKMQASMNRTTKPGGSYDDIAQELNRQSGKDSGNATRYRKLADAAEKKLKSTPKKKAKSGTSMKKCKYGCK